MSDDQPDSPRRDPTPNVLDLVRAAERRQDDLRTQEAAHVRELLANERRYNDSMRRAETGRLNAIREVDISAAVRAAEVATTTATTLAAQVTQTSETMRAQVSATAEVAARTLVTTIQPLVDAIADLRRVQYEQAGQQVAKTETRGVNQWAIGFAVSALFGVAGLVVSIVVLLA